MGATSIVHEFSVLYSRDVDVNHRRKHWDDGFLRKYQSNNVWEVVNAQGRRVMATTSLKPGNTGLEQLRHEGFQLLLEDKMLLEIVDGEDKVSVRSLVDVCKSSTVKEEPKDEEIAQYVKQETLTHITPNIKAEHDDNSIRNEQTHDGNTLRHEESHENDFKPVIEDAKPVLTKSPTKDLKSYTVCVRIPTMLSRTLRYLPKACDAAVVTSAVVAGNTNKAKTPSHAIPLLSFLFSSLDDEIIEDSEPDYAYGNER